MGGRLCTGARMIGNAAGLGAGKTTSGRLALAASSFSRTISCADFTKRPAGTRVVKLGGVSTAGVTTAGTGGSPTLPSGGTAVAAALGPVSAGAAAAFFWANSCSSAAEVILSIVLETDLTG